MGTKVRRRATSPIAFMRALGASGALLLLSSTASAQHYLFNRANFPVHSALGGMATADFNRDGILDLAVVSSGPSGMVPPTTLVSVLLGKPDGTFQAPVEYQTGGE